MFHVKHFGTIARPDRSFLTTGRRAAARPGITRIRGELPKVDAHLAERSLIRRIQCGIEDERRIGRTIEPAIMLHLGLELPRRPAGVSAVYQRTADQDGRITNLALPAGDTIALSYDAASRITGRTETGQPAQNFGYDALDRLAIYANGAATQTYTYDANGNRTGYLDNATPPVSLAYTIDPASNRLLGIGGSWAGSFTYDASGSMLSYSTPYSGYSFVYDARNRQTQAYVGAIGTSWLINGLGQRIAQINVRVPEFFFVHDEAGHLAGKYDGGGNLLWETAWLGDLPVAAGSPAGLFTIAPDHLGAPHQITDATGAVAWQWNPDPFGNGAPVGAFAYELRFPGQYFDQATKLHYNYFRDYDPRTGRYIESDPVGLIPGFGSSEAIPAFMRSYFSRIPLAKRVERGINQPYTYVGNDPIALIDPFGLYGTGDCSYYAQRCAQVGGRYYCFFAQFFCNNSPNNEYFNCVRQCLQTADTKFCNTCGGVAGFWCGVDTHQYCYTVCAENTNDPPLF